MGDTWYVDQGWCIDTDHTIGQNTWYDVNIYSSYEDLPPELIGGTNIEHPENLDLVNWIINQDFVYSAAYDNLLPDAGGNGLGEYLGDYTYSDVQRAIWALIENTQSGSGLRTWSQARVDEILAAAAEHEGYKPTHSDDTIAVIIQPINGGQITIAQLILIEFTHPDIPCKQIWYTDPEQVNFGNYRNVFDISGHVFHDINPNYILDDDEPLFEDVRVELWVWDEDVGDWVFLYYRITDDDGYYIFEEQEAGKDYCLRVPMETEPTDDYNEMLYEYYYLVVAPDCIEPLEQDEYNKDFGYRLTYWVPPPDTGGGNGKTIGFWKHQCTQAIKGKTKGVQVDAETLQGYLDDIEELYLYEPFQFDDDNEYLAAFEIMQKQTKVAQELLAKQLLGAEFNEVAGWGLAGPNKWYQSNLIQLGEYVYNNYEDFTRDEILTLKDIFDMINNSGE
jgi:hypothetical protein